MLPRLPARVRPGASGAAIWDFPCPCILPVPGAPSLTQLWLAWPLGVASSWVRPHCCGIPPSFPLFLERQNFLSPAVLGSYPSSLAQSRRKLHSPPPPRLRGTWNFPRVPSDPFLLTAVGEGLACYPQWPKGTAGVPGPPSASTAASSFGARNAWRNAEYYRDYRGMPGGGGGGQEVGEVRRGSFQTPSLAVLPSRLPREYVKDRYCLPCHPSVFPRMAQ